MGSGGRSSDASGSMPPTLELDGRHVLAVSISPWSRRPLVAEATIEGNVMDVIWLDAEDRRTWRSDLFTLTFDVTRLARATVEIPAAASPYQDVGAFVADITMVFTGPKCGVLDGAMVTSPHLPLSGSEFRLGSPNSAGQPQYNCDGDYADPL